MTFPDYLELAAYWRTCPPTHLLVKAFLGYKGDETRTNGLARLLAEAGPDGMFAKP